MILFTSHTKPGQPPVLVREGFSWGACIFGAIWLAVHRAWAAAILVVLLFLMTLVLGRFTGTLAPMLGLATLQGLLGPDLWRGSLAARGFVQGPVVGAADRDQAFARLLEARPNFLPAEFSLTPGHFG